MDISVKVAFWFLVIALIANRLIIGIYYKSKPDYEDWKDYYLGFFHATLMALVAVSIIGNYPADFW